MRALSAIACALLLVAPSAARATITIVNTDGPNEGFNDPTPVAPIGGNPGTTIGQQRLNVFNRAAQIWDGIIQSPVQILIDASFDPLSCTATSGVLGSAGPNTVDANFTGAGFANTWYVGAEANRLAGTDLDVGIDDITAQFNSSVGSATCLTGRSWYYGFDDNEGASGIDLQPVLLHEFGHGLGFLTTTDESSGSFFSGLPSIFDRYLMDDVSGKHWFEMTDAERVASAINTGHLVWDGPAVTAAAPHFLGHRPIVVTTGAITGTFPGGEASFGTPLTTTGMSGDLVLVNDGVSTTTDGCETPFVNAAQVSGRIAVIDRGTCSFVQKALNAQAAGAIGVLIVNNAAGPPPAMSGTGAVTIPVESVSQSDGTAIKTAMGSGTVHAKLALDPVHLAGATDAGKVLMYAPNPDQPGSSVSHWDVSAFPNLLMEPAINPDLTTNVDMTFHAFFDIGWFPQLAGVPAAPAPSVALAAAPNPAHDASTLHFDLAASGDVDLGVYDLAGRRIDTIASGWLAAGPHVLRWDRRDEAGRRVAPGVYLVRLRGASLDRSLHMVLVD